MTEEKLVERVTALFADSDAAQRKMIRLYAETNDAIEASAIIDSGAEVLHMLQGGLRPEVLVLDEATSALDNDTEAAIMESINRLHGKKTLIIIAHRLQTIEKCDMVFRVENGSIDRER